MSTDTAPGNAGDAFPALTLVLPGTWVQVPVRDQARVDRLVDMIEPAEGARRAQRWRERLAHLRDVGGDQVLLSTSDPASVVVTSWPEAVATGTEELLAVAGRVTEARSLAHREGWPLVRIDGETPEGTIAAYWLAHPRTGRVLTIEVSVDVPDFEDSRWRAMDALVADLEWTDPAEEEAARAAPR